MRVKKEKDIDLSIKDRFDHYFLDNNIHFLSGGIEEKNIRKAVQWIVFKNGTPATSDQVLTLYVNSMGGDLYNAFALIDIMKASKIPIRTIGVGSIMSAGFLIFVSGTKGQRYIGRNTGCMIHQFEDIVSGKHHDIKSSMREADYCLDRMQNILQEATSMDSRTVKSKLLSPTDVWLTSDEMVSLGLADYILQ